MQSAEMENVPTFSAPLAPQPQISDGNGHALEYIFRDAVLAVLVPQVEYTDPWKWDQPPEEHPATFATLETLRGTCRSWAEFVEGTAEWGALTLARDDFQSLQHPRWMDEEEYVHFRFQHHRSLFSTSWRLKRPLVDDRWRTAPFATLTAVDLRGLSSALQEDGDYCEHGADSNVLRPAPNLWIAPRDRLGGH